MTRETKRTDTSINQSKPTLLLVEDDEGFRNFLTLYFNADFTVIAFANGDAAIKAIGHLNKIDLLLTDFDLQSAVDGLDVVRAMRTKNAKVPILLMTGSEASLPRIQELLAHECTTFLRKPFQLEEIDEAIRAVLAQRRRMEVEDVRQL